MRKILITGGTGFLGRSATEYFRKKGNFVVPVSRKDFDIRDTAKLINVLNENDIDTIIHFAAVSTVGEAFKNPYETISTNVMGTTSVLEAARLSNTVKRVIVMGTDKEYGEVENADENAPLAVNSGIYGVSKLASSLIALAYRKDYSMNVTVIRSVNIYGPQDTNLTRIIPKAVFYYTHGLEFPVYTPTGKRGYIFITDFLDAVNIILDHSEIDVINVCSNDVLDSEELVKKIAQYLHGFKYTLVARPYPEISKQSLSCEKLKSLGWTQKINIDEGLKITIEGLLEKFK